MKIIEKLISIKEENFILTNQRALFWKEASALILSDLHLGKTAHFRKNGIPLPSDIILEDLKRLSDLINHFNPKKIIVVGDFLHAGKNSEFEIYKNWKLQFPALKIILVKGNHDRISEKYLFELGISDIYSVYQENEFTFSHEDLKNESQFVISGHIHPGVVLQSSTRKLKFPCYVVTENQLILPAFSTFTGLDTNNYFPESQKYIVTQDSIHLIQ
ncbi:ligase-associated DNA damage response endonuclease PdeM [Chryseobacterium sp.]|uniref:ligase-associated DNA damage response endonuclease PdeM n=1 Tax=Chryseobacterium sp. TaxID=1871047 RepID=UPI0012C06A8A|nr:ligase-associated DNA damage response endonuclease PdeM [Chryseobacterium sp.]MPS64733.1 ligase-associated DNA damage response endonuclease PdeM [Chryseobacterium sp.]